MCFELPPISCVQEIGGSSKPRENAAFSLCNVVAIENDTALVEHLRKLFSDARNVQVVGCDLRNI